MGLYVTFLYSGATLAPLMAGFIYNGMGWKAVLVSPAQDRSFPFRAQWSSDDMKMLTSTLHLIVPQRRLQRTGRYLLFLLYARDQL